MLVVTRKPNESLILDVDGKRIEVKILGVKGNQVRVGTDAPKDVHIIRDELLKKYDK